MVHLQGYLAHLRAAHLSEQTLAAYESDVLLLSRFMDTLGLSLLDASTRDLEAFLASRRVKASTTSRRITALAGFFRWAIKVGLTASNPTEELRRPRKQRSLPRPLSPQQVVDLLDFAKLDSSFTGMRTWALLETAYAIGARIGELLTLTVPDLNLEAGTVFLEGKGRKQRHVPITRAGARALRTWLARRDDRLRRKCRERLCPWVFPTMSGHQLSRNKAIHDVRTVGRAAGIAGRVTPHMLRHSYATHLHENGMEIETLQRLLGHEDIGTTMGYVEISPRRIRASFLANHPRS